MDVTVGATLTGGSTVALKPAGVTAGKSTFVTPTHTRLAPRLVEMTIGGAGTGANPVARTGVKITYSDRNVEEGCCTVQEGSVIVDLGVRWSLNQPATLADDVVALLRGLVYTTAFVDAIKKGILPSS